MAGTVFILGAGASRAETINQVLPMPLVNDFFSEKYLTEFWSDTSQGSKFTESPLYFVLTQYFANTQSARSIKKSLENINIEEVYSFLHSFDKVFSGRSYRRDEFETARRQLHLYIITVIRYTSWQIKESVFLRKLALSLTPSDSIITFNWDTLIDQALDNAQTSATKGLVSRFLLSANPDRSPKHEDHDVRLRQLHAGQLLKVHGATNLTHCKNFSCYRHENPYVWNHSEESPEYWECDECGSPTQELILSPHGAKTYTTNRYFRLQANLAAEKLSIAQRIVIIGYSFPAFDIEARSMLRCSRLDDRHSEAWLREVVIVDPMVARRDRIKGIANLIGIDNENAHGHEVQLSLYKSVQEFTTQVL